MKYLKLLILSLCLASFPLVSGMTCSQSQQTVTYQTLFQLETAANTSFAALTDLVVAGKVPASTYTPIARDYNLFQAAMSAAVTAANGSTTAPAPAPLIAQQSALLAKIVTAKGAN